jgi:hypothetical protein
LCSRRRHAHESWIENLRYAVEVFDERGNLMEVLAGLYDLDAAHAAYNACRRKRPTKLIMLCQKGQIIRQRDRDEVRTL